MSAIFLPHAPLFQCQGVIEKFRGEGRLEGVTPADVDRQREIINRPLSALTARHRKMQERRQHSRKWQRRDDKLPDVVEVTTK